MKKKTLRKIRGKRKTRKPRKRIQRGGALPDFIQVGKIFMVEFTPNEMDTLPEDYINSNNKKIFVSDIREGNKIIGIYSFLNNKDVQIIFNNDKFYFYDKFKQTILNTEVNLTDVSDVPRTDSEREELEAVKNEIDRVKLHIEVLSEELEGIEADEGPLSDESWKLDRELNKIEREKEAKLFKPCPTCKDRQQSDDRYSRMNASERSFYDEWKFKN